MKQRITVPVRKITVGDIGVITLYVVLFMIVITVVVALLSVSSYIDAANPTSQTVPTMLHD